ncbi:hypothetical protein SNEBB_005676 [Seison nebaliae]|nr:hypothetical protein SNEBB_005676 [Seison nebaliae]
MAQILGDEEPLDKKYCPFAEKKENDVMCGDPASSFKKHIKLKSKERQELLDIINEVRRNAGGADMTEVDYNLSLESIGVRMSWRGTSKTGVTYDINSKHNIEYRGLCIAETDYGNMTIGQILKKHADKDKDNFEYGKLLEKPKKESGDAWEKYTHQSYWFFIYSEIFQMGCGITEHDSSVGKKVCCVVFHRGLTKKQFTKGKSCSKCPSSCPCREKLCNCAADFYTNGASVKFYGIISLIIFSTNLLILHKKLY